jgi:predicted small lipoprotein YifL
MRALLIILAASVPLAACGRVGPPRPPGPKEDITYPRAYPAPTAVDREVARTRALGIPPGIPPGAGPAGPPVPAPPVLAPAAPVAR